MKVLKNKETKQILLSAILIVILIALYVEANVLIEKINIPKVDITESKVYSISNKTKDYLSKLDKDVDIKMVDFDAYSNYIYAREIEDLLNKYAKESDKIKLSKDEDNSSSTNYPYIVFYCDNLEYSLSLEELYSYKYNVNNAVQEEQVIAESVITNVINTLTEKKQDKVYVYLEKSMYSEKMILSVINRINGLGIDAVGVSLKDGKKIPDDCKVLIIPPLATVSESNDIVSFDLTKDERDELERYINNGGNILFLQESKTTATGETPNLDYILGLYGISISDGYVLEPNNKIQDNPGYIYPQTAGNMWISDLKICLFDAGKINIANSDELNSLNVREQVLLKASKDAFIRKNINDNSQTKSENDEDGANAILGVYAEKTVNSNVSEAIVYSNSLFMLNSPVYINETYRNKKIAIEMILIDDNEEFLAKSIMQLLDDDDITYNKKARSTTVPAVGVLKDGITLKVLFVIPFIVLIVGYVVWRYRKNKK